MYELFWEKVQLMCESVDVDPASLPRKRKASKSFEVGSSESFLGPCIPNAIKNRCYQKPV